MPSYTIPYGVTTIGGYAFGNASNLTSIIICADVETIGDDAFDYCSNLTSVTLGENVKTIGICAFDYCDGLESIYSLNPEPPTLSSSFYDVDKEKCILYVPIGSYWAYATTAGWAEFIYIVEMDMTGIEEVSAEDAEADIVGVYTIDGKQINTPQRGINIVRYSDGTTKKAIVK